MGVAAVAGGSAAAHSARKVAPPPVKLASTAMAPHRPTTVLIHGLDSSKETWSGVLADLATAGYPAVALDLRGHGESPLGDIDTFGPDTLAADVRHAIEEMGIQRAVVVGHSMGGRIAMRLAADELHAERPLLAACVIEDMDTRVRAAAPELTPELSTALGEWHEESGRRWPSWAAVREALLPWYGDAKRVEGWRGKRVRPLPGGSWWSDVNPAAMRLARSTVLDSEDAHKAWAALAEAAQSESARRFALHLWVADTLTTGRGTVCALEGEGSIAQMAERLPAASVRHFKGAGHSIHNTNREEFVEALREVVDKAALNTYPGPACYDASRDRYYY